MEVVAHVRSYTLRGAEKLSSLWRQSVLAKGLLLLSALLLALLVFAALNAVLRPAAVANLTPVTVEGVFADINGDGLVDYVVKAEVIVNKGPLGP
jgi:hypothetical protein